MILKMRPSDYPTVVFGERGKIFDYEWDGSLSIHDGEHWIATYGFVYGEPEKILWRD